MKTAFGALFTLGIGVIGLVVGGGLGIAGANTLVTPKATVAGACSTVDAAFRAGTLTAEQARQLGINTAKENAGMADLVRGKNVSVEDQGAACQQFLQGLKGN